MDRYAIVLQDEHSVWVEFYWADDIEHALEQAKNAHPETTILSINMSYLRTKK
jgi:hypothetical protein